MANPLFSPKPRAIQFGRFDSVPRQSVSTSRMSDGEAFPCLLDDLSMTVPQPFPQLNDGMFSTNSPVDFFQYSGEEEHSFMDARLDTCPMSRRRTCSSRQPSVSPIQFSSPSSPLGQSNGSVLCYFFTLSVMESEQHRQSASQSNPIDLIVTNVEGFRMCSDGSKTMEGRPIAASPTDANLLVDVIFEDTPYDPINVIQMRVSIRFANGREHRTSPETVYFQGMHAHRFMLAVPAADMSQVQSVCVAYGYSTGRSDEHFGRSFDYAVSMAYTNVAEC